jgi:hypothetical protein
MDPGENGKWLFKRRHRRTSNFEIQTLKLIFRLRSNYKVLGNSKQMADIDFHLGTSRAN